MIRWFCIAAVALCVVSVPVQAGSITGQYIEARTCEVYGGPCFANADTGLTGRNAVLAWKVDEGSMDDVSLDGLGIAAVISASDTLGLRQSIPVKVVLIVDSRASTAQRAALIRLAKEQGGKLMQNVVAIQSAPVELDLCACKENACAKLSAGPARIETRCIDHEHDVTCSNAEQLYPPLTAGLKNARAATTVEHAFTGKVLNETWKDHGRRAAYLGSFEMK